MAVNISPYMKAVVSVASALIVTLGTIYGHLPWWPALAAVVTAVAVYVVPNTPDYLPTFPNTPVTPVTGASRANPYFHPDGELKLMSDPTPAEENTSIVVGGQDEPAPELANPVGAAGPSLMGLTAPTLPPLVTDTTAASVPAAAASDVASGLRSVVSMLADVINKLENK